VAFRRNALWQITYVYKYSHLLTYFKVVHLLYNLWLLCRWCAVLPTATRPLWRRSTHTPTAVMLVIVTTAITQVMSGTANLSHALKNVINFTKRKMLDTRNTPHHSCVAAHAWKWSKVLLACVILFKTCLAFAMFHLFAQKNI